ncbi:MAG: hypothetical protein H8D87_08925 [Deltaproteobacteria bacterium]|nr:hypothetical protein [Candidatus Desulfobacula maris]
MSSPPGIFVDDFERTENSDTIQAIIGRSLILATRFDLMCTQLIRTMTIREAVQNFRKIDDEAFSKFVDDLYSYTDRLSLDDTIKSFGLPGSPKKALHRARKARNQIVHSLCQNLIGCIEMDEFIEEGELIKKISKLCEAIAPCVRIDVASIKN